MERINWNYVTGSPLGLYNMCNQIDWTLCPPVQADLPTRLNEWDVAVAEVSDGGNVCGRF